MAPKLPSDFAFKPLEPNTVVFTGEHADRYEQAEFERHGLTIGTRYHVVAINGRQIFLTGYRSPFPTSSFCTRSQWAEALTAN